uniref:Mpv17-like protein 2 n=1 Tax=Ciona savignyi TaxID=51511 RepID=H2YN68_CIOSA
MQRTKFIFSKFTSLYKGRYAVVTNTITVGAMAVFSDVTTQKIEGNKLDMTRTKHMGILATGCGPLMHYWYRFLDQRFTKNVKRAVLKKVVLDVIVSPLWYAIYLTGFCVLKKYSREKAVSEMKGKLPILISFDLLSWPVFQTVNFALLPPHFRVVGVKVNEFFLGIVGSHLLNNPYDFRKILEDFKKK